MIEQQEKKSTHRVDIVPVVMRKHSNADQLSIVDVFGYQVVVRTEDWVGVGKGVYIQPDMVVPDQPQYAFLRANNQPLRLTDRRIRVRKFRGEWSQGLLMPVPTELSHLPIGSDVSDLLQITRYEPPEPQGSAGNDNEPGPSVPKFDVENWYRYPQVFTPGELVHVTEKIHGANFKATFTKFRGEEKVFVGSRNLWKKFWTESEPVTWWDKLLSWVGLFRPRITHHSNWWVDVYDKYSSPYHFGDLGLEEMLGAYPNTVVYGEVYGDVQDLKYGCQPGELKLVVFDMFDTDFDEWLSPDIVSSICNDFHVQIGRAHV